MGRHVRRKQGCKQWESASIHRTRFAVGADFSCSGPNDRRKMHVVGDWSLNIYTAFYYLMLAACLVLGAYLHVRRRRDFNREHETLDQRIKKIRDIETKVNVSLRCGEVTSIRHAPTGQVVKIGGQIETAGQELRSPLSGRACVFYDIVVEQHAPGGPGPHQWLPLFRDTNAVDFYIVDDTDRALVQLAKLRTELRAAAERDHYQVSGSFKNVTPELERYLRQHGHSSTVLGTRRELRYREGVFEAGERVVAMGTALREQSTESRTAGSGYRSAAQRFILGPLPGGSILISDDSALAESTASS